MKEHRLSAADAVDVPGDPDLNFRQFLDDFRYEPESSCRRLISEEPKLTGNDFYDVRIAATVEALSHERGIEPPQWVYAPSRYLKKKTYTLRRVCAKSQEARDWFEATTPPEFASRNLFCGDNPLSRC